jgi:hypothetical protein
MSYVGSAISIFFGLDSDVLISPVVSVNFPLQPQLIAKPRFKAITWFMKPYSVQLMFPAYVAL